MSKVLGALRLTRRVYLLQDAVLSRSLLQTTPRMSISTSPHLEKHKAEKTLNEVGESVKANLGAAKKKGEDTSEEITKNIGKATNEIRKSTEKPLKQMFEKVTKSTKEKLEEAANFVKKATKS